MSDLLKRTGEALYGSQWQSAIARDLDVSDRHVRRMAAGEQPLKPGMALDLWRITLERTAVLEDLVEELKRASTP
ncbi:adhesin [Shinella sp. JR1-6]|uniref:adhesin n=1 Tax=Shinella sp. JR1-6 TaxID=2527671 RepID=UPI00102D5B39|nr:adhesin [Shinella sp. JR1-6]TAA54067.1 adhesin [Shinella sp. JR1-6]